MKFAYDHAGFTAEADWVGSGADLNGLTDFSPANEKRSLGKLPQRAPTVRSNTVSLERPVPAELNAWSAILLSSYAWSR